jgi:uncharacterized protein involved in cysteine biosynthesis
MRFGAVQAASALLAGIRLSLSERGLRRMVLGTVALNAALFVAIAALAIWAGWALPHWLADRGWLPEAAAWLGPLAVLVGLFFLAPVLFNLVGTLAMMLVRERIFRRAREAASGPRTGEVGGTGALARIAVTEVMRLVRLVLVSLLILPLNLIPVAGSIAYLVLQFAVAARTMAWDLLSHHFELHDLAYAQQKQFMAENRAGALTLGGLALALGLVPLAQLVFFSTNVAGAGVLSARIDAQAEARAA